MKKRYEVQHFSLFDGWVNTWSFQEEILDGIFTEVPETFATRKEAQAALDEFLRFTQDEIDAGQRAAAEGYDPDDFRIAQVQLARAGVP
jgi:hypothetical protein